MVRVESNRSDSKEYGVEQRASHRDITTSKQAGLALRAEQLRFEHGPVIAISWEERAGWPVCYISANIVQFGYLADDFLSGRLNYVEIIHPADIERVLTEIAHLRATSAPPPTPMEYRIICADGSLRYVADYRRPVYDEAGNIARIDGYIQDITARKTAEETVHSSQRRLQTILDNAAVGIFLLSPDGRWLEINQRGMLMLGYSQEELREMHYGDVLVPADRQECLATLQTYSWHQQPQYRSEQRYLRKDGSVFWGDLSLAAIFAADGTVEALLGVLVNISGSKEAEAALQMANAQLQQQVVRDPLTRLYNRRYLDATLPRELQRAVRQNQPVGVIMLDIDHFKRFNDNYGHDAGDTLLRAIGAFLESRVRGEDIACRYGGEEFTLVLPGAALEDTQQRAAEIHASVRHLVVQHQGRCLDRVTVSMGVAVFPAHGTTADDTIRAADRALYRAKRAGRDRVVTAADDDWAGF